MRLRDLVASGYDRFDAGAAMADVAALCAHDRYQASAGINDAARYVAARAEAAGLRDVAILAFPADGARHWWTYHAPASWTPLRARLTVGGAEVVRYPEQPYTLAAYSAATPPGGAAVRLRRWSDVDGHATSGTSTTGTTGATGAPGDLTGTLVVMDTAVAPGTAAQVLTAAGAAGMVIDPLAGRAGRDPEQVGRLELLPGARIAAFSVPPAALRQLLAGADTGTAARIEVVLCAEYAPMPVVTALLPGDGDDEILLSAHLCHPRPSANDNASGVAALLGAARVLADPDAAGAFGGRDARGPGGGAGREGNGRPGVRFLWGPEFTGAVAYLHDVVHAGHAPVPSFGINVDMAGEDLGRCGGPLVIERGPDDLPSPLPALVERCASLVPPRTWSYSGAVPCDPWTWRATPFAGGSDHALLAGAPTRTPALSLGHWPDRTNHSSLDTVDAVDPAELRRTTSIVVATVAALRACADPGVASDLAAATVGWGADHILSALPGRRPSSPPSPPSPATRDTDRTTGGAGVLDPHADAEVPRLLRHRATVARGAVDALVRAGIAESQVRAAGMALDAIATAVLAGFAPPPSTSDGSDDPPLVPRWTGPVNLRALAGAATAGDRAWLDELSTRDRGGTYARALALLGSIDGVRGRRAAAWWAALASELPMPVDFADRFFDMACRAGWAATTLGREC